MVPTLDVWWCIPDSSLRRTSLKGRLSGFNCIVRAACGFRVTSQYLWAHSPSIISIRMFAQRIKSTPNFLRVEVRIY
ncbi:hypothetical protein BT93_H1660 [Corymbia citriodora subsp. variegata]|nr:hypothetical protein BT93_H1660 [Corymbia citriodora subsp. variegata]